MTADDPSKIKLGTCAWSFDDWRGVFYPPDLPANQWLAHYARHLPAVEIDSTFYAAPKPQTAAHWLEAVPPGFSFTCKLPRAITHDARLRDSREAVRQFLVAMAPLRSRLGCVLVQLPPSFSPKNDEQALREFVMGLPRDCRFAIEFGDDGWHLPRIIRLLEEHGVCWVWSDTTALAAQDRGAFEPSPQTADFLYIRLLGDLGTKYRGDGSRVHRYGHILWPRDSSLDSWAVKIQRHAEENGVIYVFVNNHFEGFSPLTCQRLGAQLGLPITLPDAAARAEEEPEEQLELL